MADFIETAVPEPVVLLGQRLKPLTIGHLFLLERFECLPVNDHEQLVLAVIICSHNHDEVMPVLEDRWWNWRMRIWRWRLGNFDWQEKYRLWNEYLEEGMATPCAVSKSDNDGLKNSATPFLQHLKTTLQAKLNYSPSEALAAPYSQAAWDYYTYHELEGTVEIADREKRKEMAEWVNENHDALIKDVLERQAKAKEETHGA